MKRYIVFVVLLMLLLSNCSPIQPELTPMAFLTVTIPSLGVGSTMISDKDGMPLVYVPGGEFTMGSDDSDRLDERPEHQVYLNAFWIDRTEITVHMYSICVDAHVCAAPVSINSFTHFDYYEAVDFENYPVIYVDWDMAKTYCEWASRRLPTEAEWEKAARGTDGRTYPWGEEISCSLANYWGGYDGCMGDTSEVDRYLDGASIYGALDMAGNTWEYVNDWYSETYYSSSPISNPLGPESGQRRVVRGGSWDDGNDVVRASFRSWVTPVGGDYSATHNQGFRCAMSANP